MVKYAGVKINDLIVPALSVGQAKRMEADIKAVGTPSEGETAIDWRMRAIPVIAEAVQRNYPDLTEEQVADQVDGSNFTQFLQAAFGVDGSTLTRGE